MPSPESKTKVVCAMAGLPPIEHKEDCDRSDNCDREQIRLHFTSSSVACATKTPRATIAVEDLLSFICNLHANFYSPMPLYRCSSRTLCVKLHRCSLRITMHVVVWFCGFTNEVPCCGIGHSRRDMSLSAGMSGRVRERLGVPSNTILSPPKKGPTIDLFYF